MCALENSDKNKSRDQLLEDLKTETGKLAAAKEVKKVDMAAHRDTISTIEAEIISIMHQLNDGHEKQE